MSSPFKFTPAPCCCCPGGYKATHTEDFSGPLDSGWFVNPTLVFPSGGTLNEVNVVTAEYFMDPSGDFSTFHVELERVTDFEQSLRVYGPGVKFGSNYMAWLLEHSTGNYRCAWLSSGTTISIFDTSTATAANDILRIEFTFNTYDDDVDIVFKVNGSAVHSPAGNDFSNYITANEWDQYCQTTIHVINSQTGVTAEWDDFDAGFG